MYTVETYSIPEIAFLTPQYMRDCEVWWQYAKQTPIYDEANMTATLSGTFFLKYFFPLAGRYNELAAMLCN